MKYAYLLFIAVFALTCSSTEPQSTEEQVDLAINDPKCGSEVRELSDGCAKINRKLVPFMRAIDSLALVTEAYNWIHGEDGVEEFTYTEPSTYSICSCIDSVDGAVVEVRKDSAGSVTYVKEFISQISKLDSLPIEDVRYLITDRLTSYENLTRAHQRAVKCDVCSTLQSEEQVQKLRAELESHQNSENDFGRVVISHYYGCQVTRTGVVLASFLRQIDRFESLSSGKISEMPINHTKFYKMHCNGD